MPPPELHYAPRPPLHRRHSVYRWLTALGFIAVAAVGALWFPVVWRQIQMIYWQHRCMIYRAPLGQIVSDSSTNRGFVPSEWTNLYTLLSPPGSNFIATLFLHERKTPNGESRLVSVNIEKTDGLHAFHFIVIDPGDIFHPPHEDIAPAFANYGRGAWPKHSMTVTAGVADPADDTHLSFEIDDDGQNYIYSAWLRNDDRFDFYWVEKRVPSTATTVP